MGLFENNLIIYNMYIELSHRLYLEFIIEMLRLNFRILFEVAEI